VRSTESGFSERVYLTAAQERITTANLLLQAEPPDYVMACYAAGVAVECLFHAYRMRADGPDTARHNVGLHAQLGLFYDGMSREQREAISALVGEVASRWQNNHRYRSTEALHEFVVAHKLYVVKDQSTTRLDAVQYNAEQLVEAATAIVTAGIKRWQRQ